MGKDGERERERERDRERQREREQEPPYPDVAALEHLPGDADVEDGDELEDVEVAVARDALHLPPATTAPPPMRACAGL